MRCSTSTSSRCRTWRSAGGLLATLLACDDARPHPAPDAGRPPPTTSAPVDAGDSFADLPDAAVADLDLRGKHLLEAIAQNDVALASDIVFPRDAWLAARDVSDPAAAYEHHFTATLASQIGRVHHHEKGIDHAVFVSFELGPNPLRAPPRHREWKEPLWRVARSSLTYTVDGRVHRLEIAEMVAWRGNWYVTRLHP